MSEVEKIEDGSIVDIHKRTLQEFKNIAHTVQINGLAAYKCHKTGTITKFLFFITKLMFIAE